jgi:hypothetical protein
MSLAMPKASIRMSAAELIEEKSKLNAKMKIKELRIEDELLYTKIGRLPDKKNIKMAIDHKQASP